MALRRRPYDCVAVHRRWGRFDVSDEGLPWGWHFDEEGSEPSPAPGADKVDRSDGPEGDRVSTSAFAELVAAASRHDIVVEPDSVAAACRAGAVRGWKQSGRWQVDASKVAFVARVIDDGLDWQIPIQPYLAGRTLTIELWVNRASRGGWKDRGQPGWQPPPLNFLVVSPRG